MALVTSVSTRGQITIDREARRELSVEPGMLAVQVVVGDHLEVYFVPAPHRRSFFGCLPPRAPEQSGTWDDIEERAAQSIAEDAA